jgi:hypothetical protein
MSEFWSAALVFVLLLGSSGTAMVLRRFLPERHRSAEAIQLVQLVGTMLVTLAALVLGLLTTSAKTSFATIQNDLRGLSVNIIELDRQLREYGAEADPARALLRSYTAAAIASTWTSERPPAGDYYPRHVEMFPGSEIESTTLTDMLGRTEAVIRGLQPADALHRGLAADCLNRFERLEQQRWKLLAEAHSSISNPFYAVLVFWLVIVFASFGLSAPRSVLSFVTIGLGALSIGSVLFVILDLDTPFGGLFVVPSAPMRAALAHLGG